MMKEKIKNIYFRWKDKRRFSNNRLRLLRHEKDFDYRENFIYLAMDYIRSNRIEGDYIEFGVFVGDTFLSAAKVAQALAVNLQKMRFIGFDSFQGLPEIKGKDAAGFRHFSEGAYLAAEEDVLQRLKRNKVDINKVLLVPGWFEDTLSPKTKTSLNLALIAFAYIDSDLYESAVLALNFITPHIQDGMVLAFDDWYCFRADRERGEQKAFSEWLKRNPNIEAIDFLRFGWGGKAFILRKKREKKGFNNKEM